MQAEKSAVFVSERAVTLISALVSPWATERVWYRRRVAVVLRPHCDGQSPGQADRDRLLRED